MVPPSTTSSSDCWVSQSSIDGDPGPFIAEEQPLSDCSSEHSDDSRMDDDLSNDYLAYSHGGMSEGTTSYLYQISGDD